MKNLIITKIYLLLAQCKFLEKNTPTLPSYPCFLFLYSSSPPPPTFFLVLFHTLLLLTKQKYFCENGNILQVKCSTRLEVYRKTAYYFFFFISSTKYLLQNFFLSRRIEYPPNPYQWSSASEMESPVKWNFLRSCCSE